MKTANVTATVRPATEKQAKFINTLIGRSEPFTPRLYKDGKYVDAQTQEEAKEAVRQFEEWRKYTVDAIRNLSSKMASKMIGLYIEINDTIRSEGYVPKEAFDELDLKEFKLFKECGIMNRAQFDTARHMN